MGMMKAAQLAPSAVLLPTDFESYRHYSRLFKDAARTFTDQIEDRGIDYLREVPIRSNAAEKPHIQRAPDVGRLHKI